MRQMLLVAAIIAVGSLALAACAEQDSATAAIERYLKAQVAGDTDKLIANACPEWEASAKTAAAAFQSVDAKIENLACEEVGEDGDYTLVTCSGTVVIQYRGEDPREQALPGLTYRAIERDGAWKMCGTQE